MDRSRAILFYHRDQPYFEFTNFAQYPIVIDEKTWPTTEHYFQAQKFIGTPYEDHIRNMSHPREAFDLSRQPHASQWRRKDWEEVKVQVMYKALLAKFSQHDKLRDMLLKTGDRELVEHTSNDSFWGDGGDGRGQNQLGKLLMRVRSQIPPVPNTNAYSMQRSWNQEDICMDHSSSRKYVSPPPHTSHIASIQRTPFLHRTPFHLPVGNALSPGWDSEMHVYPTKRSATHHAGRGHAGRGQCAEIACNGRPKGRLLRRRVSVIVVFCCALLVVPVCVYIYFIRTSHETEV